QSCQNARPGKRKTNAPEGSEARDSQTPRSFYEAAINAGEGRREWTHGKRKIEENRSQQDARKGERQHATGDGLVRLAEQTMRSCRHQDIEAQHGGWQN